MKKWTRPSPSVFAYCKRSKTGRWEGLGTRLCKAYVSCVLSFISLPFPPTLPPSHLTGLPSLPLLLALVNVFKADISARDAGGLTPLSLAAKIGEEKVAEVRKEGDGQY